MVVKSYLSMKSEFRLTKTDVSVLKFLIKNITKKFSINNISDAIYQGYTIVRESVLKLEKENIIEIVEINPTQKLCGLNTKNNKNINIFSYIEFLRSEAFFSKKGKMRIIADDILDKINSNSFSMLFFGSYVKDTETKSSDIDVVFLMSRNEDKKKLLNAVTGAGRLTNNEVHPVFMLYNDFFEVLRNESATLPKEVLENHIFVYGAESFYRALI